MYRHTHVAVNLNGQDVIQGDMRSVITNTTPNTISVFHGAYLQKQESDGSWVPVTDANGPVGYVSSTPHLVLSQQPNQAVSVLDNNYSFDTPPLQNGVNYRVYFVLNRFETNGTATRMHFHYSQPFTNFSP